MVLFLNDISGMEVLVIFIFILMFFGSKSIPGIARSLGRGIRQIKEASNEIQSEIKKSGGDFRKDLNLQNLIQDTAKDIQQPLDQYASDLENAIKYEPSKKSHIPAEIPSIVEIPTDENANPVENIENQEFTNSTKKDTAEPSVD